MTTVEVFAPAKVNLTLHVTGQRPDGYHLIDSLVAFADMGDTVKLQSSEAPGFKVVGPYAQAVPDGDDNLVTLAIRQVAPEANPFVELDKNLPPASGIGGGSADAAAAVRGVLALSGTPRDSGITPSLAHDLLSLGADVPMCLRSCPAHVRGIGERLDPVPGLPPLNAVLANPGCAVATPAVFSALRQKTNPLMPALPGGIASVTDFAEWLGQTRNDLEDPACQIAPPILETLRALREAPGALLARMSGSGATCFALFPDRATAVQAAKSISAEHPGWWVRATVLGDQSGPAQPQVIRATT